MVNETQMTQTNSQPEEKHFDLIIAIVNKGYTDIIMQAAKSKGARGGTTFSARGTGNKELGSFYGIAIEPEKDVVFIVVETKIRDDVLLAIYKEAGLETKGVGIAFSVSLTDVVGLDDAMKETIDKISKEE